MEPRSPARSPRSEATRRARLAVRRRGCVQTAEVAPPRRRTRAQGEGDVRGEVRSPGVPEERRPGCWPSPPGAPPPSARRAASCAARPPLRRPPRSRASASPSRPAAASPPPRAIHGGRAPPRRARAPPPRGGGCEPGTLFLTQRLPGRAERSPAPAPSSPRARTRAPPRSTACNSTALVSSSAARCSRDPRSSWSPRRRLGRGPGRGLGRDFSPSSAAFFLRAQRPRPAPAGLAPLAGQHLQRHRQRNRVEPKPAQRGGGGALVVAVVPRRLGVRVPAFGFLRERASFPPSSPPSSSSSASVVAARAHARASASSAASAPPRGRAGPPLARRGARFAPLARRRASPESRRRHPCRRRLTYQPKGPAFMPPARHPLGARPRRPCARARRSSARSSVTSSGAISSSRSPNRRGPAAFAEVDVSGAPFSVFLRRRLLAVRRRRVRRRRVAASARRRLLLQAREF